MTHHRKTRLLAALAGVPALALAGTAVLTATAPAATTAWAGYLHATTATSI